uniref:Uncharacterized protein n=1 Tax=Anguilla anguilla TaxID=7936 RepID=A0A0E9XJX5_ANGAN
MTTEVSYLYCTNVVLSNTLQTESGSRSQSRERGIHTGRDQRALESSLRLRAVFQ